MLSVVFTHKSKANNGLNNRVDIKAMDDWNNAKNDYLYDVGGDDPWEGIDQPTYEDLLSGTGVENGQPEKELEDAPQDYNEDGKNDGKGAELGSDYIDERYNEANTGKEPTKPLASQFWSEWLKSSSEKTDAPTQSTTPVPPKIMPNKQKSSPSKINGKINEILDLFEEEVKKLPREVK